MDDENKEEVVQDALWPLIFNIVFNIAVILAMIVNLSFIHSMGSLKTYTMENLSSDNRSLDQTLNKDGSFHEDIFAPDFLVMDGTTTVVERKPD